jgi:uncharacterized integral membrane protein
VFKAVVSLIIVILLVIFASQNMDHAEVNMVMGSPTKVPLILIIAGAFIAGYATALITFVMSATRKKKARQSLPEQYPR